MTFFAEAVIIKPCLSHRPLYGINISSFLLIQGLGFYSQLVIHSKFLTLYIIFLHFNINLAKNLYFFRCWEILEIFAIPTFWRVLLRIKNKDKWKVYYWSRKWGWLLFLTLLWMSNGDGGCLFILSRYVGHVIHGF